MWLHKAQCHGTDAHIHGVHGKVTSEVLNDHMPRRVYLTSCYFSKRSVLTSEDRNNVSRKYQNGIFFFF